MAGKARFKTVTYAQAQTHTNTMSFTHANAVRWPFYEITQSL